jgi:hypothetical protein
MLSLFSWSTMLHESNRRESRLSGTNDQGLQFLLASSGSRNSQFLFDKVLSAQRDAKRQKNKRHCHHQANSRRDFKKARYRYTDSQPRPSREQGRPTIIGHRKTPRPCSIVIALAVWMSTSACGDCDVVLADAIAVLVVGKWCLPIPGVPGSVLK